MKNLYKHLTVCFLVLAVSLLIQSNSFATIYPVNRTYSGLEEVPPNASPGTGTIVGTYDDVTNTIAFTINFSGLLANTQAAHFHCCAPIGVNAPVIINYAPQGFPFGVTAGSFSTSYVLTAGQETSLLGGLVYSNIHTTQFPGGEIRTQMILDTPLPVELSNFASTVTGNSVTLNWTTSNELNNSGFDIERKAITSNEWTRAGFVEGHGTVNGTSN